jgi:hypothetical protein
MSILRDNPGRREARFAPAITCVHARVGLCSHCLDDFERDPVAYLNFGFHPAGIARWKAFCEEMAHRYRDASTPPSDDVPF